MIAQTSAMISITQDLCKSEENEIIPEYTIKKRCRNERNLSGI